MLLTSVRDDVLLRGRGFIVARGLPVERYSIAQAAAAFLGIGAYFGKPVSQNGKGHILGHVKDLGRSIDDPTARIYQTTHRQTFHTGFGRYCCAVMSEDRQEPAA